MNRPLLAWLDRIPPYLYRLLAKRKLGGVFRPLSVREIATQAGLSDRTVERLSLATTFAGVTVDTADRFIHGCGFHPFRQARVLETLKRITQSKQGLSGVRHLANAGQLQLWEMAARKRQLHRLKAILEKK